MAVKTNATKMITCWPVTSLRALTPLRSRLGRVTDRLLPCPRSPCPCYTFESDAVTSHGRTGVRLSRDYYTADSRHKPSGM